MTAADLVEVGVVVAFAAVGSLAILYDPRPNLICLVVVLTLFIFELL